MHVMNEKVGGRLSLSLIGLVIFNFIGCAPPNHDSDGGSLSLVSDVQTACEGVKTKYYYFKKRAAHWEQSCEKAAERAAYSKTRATDLSILEELIDDLFDPHINLNTNNQNSPRLLPSGTDVWLEASESGQYFISAIRPNTGAAASGLNIGDKLVAFNGLDPDRLALSRIHNGREQVSEKRKLWAINAAIAGRRNENRDIQVSRGDQVLSFALTDLALPRSEANVSSQIVGQNIGYIKFNNSLGDSSTVASFSAALEDLRETKGLIIDLRETPGGGNTGVAEPILGRFVSKARPYQRTVFANGTKVDRKLTPNGGWTYEAPIVVLVGRWTGSMGEGMAIGFDGMNRGTVMGSDMARLAGGTKPIDLEFSKISLWIPTYDLHHINGTPRHEWSPPFLMIADNGNEEDLLFKKAMSRLFEKQ